MGRFSPEKFSRLSLNFTKKNIKRQEEFRREGETGFKLHVLRRTDRPDRLAQLRQTDGEEERDRNERKISSQTDGQSVKQTAGRTGV